MENELLEKFEAVVFNNGSFERINRKMYGAAFRVVRRRQDAEDVVQEAFLNALRSLETFKGEMNEERVGRWLNTIAFNKGKDHVRTVHPKGDFRNAFDMAAVDERYLSGLTSRGTDALGEYGAREERGHKMSVAEGILEEMPRAERDVLVLRCFGGQSYQKIADTFEIPLGTVKSRLCRASGRKSER